MIRPFVLSFRSKIVFGFLQYSHQARQISQNEVLCLLIAQSIYRVKKCSFSRWINTEEQTDANRENYRYYYRQDRNNGLPARKV